MRRLWIVIGALALLAGGVWPAHAAPKHGVRPAQVRPGTEAAPKPGGQPAPEQPAPARTNESPQVFTNSIKMEFRLIPPGRFLMGSSPDERGRNVDEHQHRVVISRPFYMQATEVTQAQYRTIMGKNPSKFKGCDRCPVDNVSWDDAQEFIRRLNAREKTNRYRLPTEAEWEYACRAGSGATYCFGDDVDHLGEYAWYWKNSSRKTHPVGQKRPNIWGLYDMHGNVAEWCGDWYKKDYYKSSPVRDPKGPSSGKYRVMRGGTYWTKLFGLGSAHRCIGKPGTRFHMFGFRVVRNM